MVYLRFPYPEDVQRILIRIGFRVGVAIDDDIRATLVHPSPEHEQVDEWLPKYEAVRLPQEYPVPPVESSEEKTWWIIFFIIFTTSILFGLGAYFFWLSTWKPSPVLHI